MKDYIEERAVAIANYIIDHNATVRQTAKRFGISKSTVHKDCTERLISINPALAAQTSSPGSEQIRASYPGWDGYKGEISIPASTCHLQSGREVTFIL